MNAVPPPGVDGMELFMDGEQLPGSNALGVGPLAIGDIKYKTESGLFKQMLASKSRSRSTSVTPSRWRGSSRLDGRSLS